jgi:hypothetical protein
MSCLSSQLIRVVKCILKQNIVFWISDESSFVDNCNPSRWNYFGSVYILIQTKLFICVIFARFTLRNVLLGQI